MRPEILIKAPSGEEFIIPPDFQEPFLAKDGGMVQMRIVEGVREFRIGSLISLSPMDMRDIVFTVWNAGLAVKSGILEFCRKNGVTIAES